MRLVEGAEGGSVHGRGPARTLLFAGIAAGGASWTPLAASAMPTLRGALAVMADRERRGLRKGN